MPAASPILAAFRRFAVMLGWLAGAVCVLMAHDAMADPEQALGNLLFTDPNLSVNRNQSCASCHSLAPATDPMTKFPLSAPGFVDPSNVFNGTPVSAGSVTNDFGTLNAPSVGYAAFSPDFYWDPVAEQYTGGLFWNGRATNLEAQAIVPMLNPVEMGMPSEWAVVSRLQENTNYVALFQQIYGIDLAAIPNGELAPSNRPAPGTVPAVFAAAAQAVAEFERSAVFNQFTSKFDYWTAGMTTLNSNELSGYALFNGRGNCINCHLSLPGTDNYGRVTPPLFTDYSYHNVGLPYNWNIPGTPPADLGLGGRPDIAAVVTDGSALGLHKVVSLRNVALTPPYGHNGVLSNLAQVVHFYNTRDTLGTIQANTNAGFGVTGWPAPEVSTNVDRALVGNLRLTATEESQLVAFLETLTDNYPNSGGDPNVPPGTPSPFASLSLPAIQVNLVPTGVGAITLWGRIGKFYEIQEANSLSTPWQPLTTVRLGTNGLAMTDTNAVGLSARFYRAVQLP